ncbi:MAG TPA: 50S ribosomal protein L17 [Waddliaceae bacterium]
MRHRKNTFKLGRTSSHNRCMISNMLKSLIDQERIQTTVAKAKELRRHADKMITLAKKNTLASRRQVVAKLMVRYNTLDSKQARTTREGKTHNYNVDRLVVSKLFDSLGPRFANRNGGYTRIVRLNNRVGDNAPTCLIEYLSE